VAELVDRQGCAVAPASRSAAALAANQRCGFAGFAPVETDYSVGDGLEFSVGMWDICGRDRFQVLHEMRD
jgi:hypothetical protein